MVIDWKIGDTEIEWIQSKNFVKARNYFFPVNDMENSREDLNVAITLLWSRINACNCQKLENVFICYDIKIMTLPCRLNDTLKNLHGILKKTNSLLLP